MDFRLVHTSNNQEFIVDVSFNVAELIIDPELWLVSKTDKIVSTRDKSVVNEIKVYPNPFAESFSIILPVGQQLVSAQLFSSDGHLLKQYTGNETTFYWPNIPKGVYILQLKTNLGVFEQKIVKQ